MLDREKFENALCENPIGFFGEKSASEISDMICEQAGTMVGYDQRNPHHCYDLMTHTLYVVDGVSADQNNLRVAAFFHDIGKPSVAFEKKGNLVFYGHPDRSVEIAEPVLKAFGYDDDDSREILFYIKNHDMFISWVFPNEPYNKKNPYLIPIVKKNLNKIIEKTELKDEKLFSIKKRRVLWQNLLKLCEADAMAQSEIVIQNGRKIGGRSEKLKKIHSLQMLIDKLV